MKYLFLLLILINSNVRSQSTFQRVYGGTGNDKIAKAIEVEDKSILILGSTENFGANSSDILFFKIDSLGNVIWRRLIGSNGIETATDFVKTNRGYSILGTTNGIGNGGYDFYLINTDVDGNVQSEFTYGGDDWDISKDLYLNVDSSLILTGYTSSFGVGNESGYLIKVNLDGDTIWTKVFHSNILDHINSITSLSDSTLYSIGLSKDLGDSLGDISIRKLKPDGSLIWQKKISSSFYDEGFKIITTSSSNLLIATHYGVNDSSGVAHGTMIDTTASILWEFETGNNTNATFNDCLELSDGKFCFVGYYKSFNNSLGSVGNGENEFLYSCVYSNGSFYFSGQFGFQNNDEANSVVEMSDHSLLIGGTTNSIGNGLLDIFIRKSLEDGFCNPNVSTNTTLSIHENAELNGGRSNSIVINNSIVMFLKPYKSYFVHDLNGRCINSGLQSSKGFELNLEGIAQGIYLLHLVGFNDNEEFIKIVR